MSEGWSEGLDLWRPGAGEIGRQVVQQTRDAIQTIQGTLQGNVVDGEAYEVVPWGRFATWLRERRWGTFVILGPKGQGKSTLALRLAEIWHDNTGYPVDLVMGYPEEMYDFVTPVSTRAFLSDIKAIIRILDPPRKATEDVEAEDDEADPTGFDPDEIDRKLQRFKRRVIVVDEMSLTVGVSGTDAGRIMVRQLMAQARHLELLIVYIGQLAKMLPNDLLTSDAIFVKKPNGRETETDREDRLTRHLWMDAMATFSTIRQSPQWEYYPDPRAWAHVECLDLGNGRSYRGPLPFSMPGEGIGSRQDNEIEEGEFEEIQE